MTINLVPYHSKYDAALQAFHLPPEQIQFSALPNKYLRTNKPGQHRIVMTNATDQPVGFFLLHETERVQDYSPNLQAMLLTTLTVNQCEQGKGYANQAMDLVSPYIQTHFPDKNEIVLVVNKKNIPAQKLYKKSGFFDTGERRVGRIGEQIVMNCMIT
ncbi:GNAT family N-acetyltransferase [Alkalihalobacillus sp. LMS6]|uniref:GNAT family N-acetyltransferase n=1 Tax=Alkalihalobacillus sp. LMS6 TaxID=2924034 RepID=UPI0020CFEE9C|nr:GNAT family N-acetyltransferase [Alkalihalobacillus sp. LMS6]UTR07210.1 GNAT family N-acetyltransferase [Alkalihalobacillus sp. LMS6]